MYSTLEIVPNQVNTTFENSRVPCLRSPTFQDSSYFSALQSSEVDCRHGCETPAVLRQADIHGQTLQTWQRRDEGKIRAPLTNLSVKNLPASWETRVQSLGREDPLEKEMATHSSILAYRIPWTEEPGELQFMESQRVGPD